MIRHVRIAQLVLALPWLVLTPQSRHTAPETFRAQAQITGTLGGVAATVSIRIDRYTADADHAAIASALKDGGYAAFVDALRKAPVVGAMVVGDRSIAIRWARERAEGDGRRIAVVTDAPVYFIGAGTADAKPTSGYDVAMAEFTVDLIGFGSGTMAAAARVKAGGPAGVEIDDYAGKRMTLMTVTRAMSYQ